MRDPPRGISLDETALGRSVNEVWGSDNSTRVQLGLMDVVSHHKTSQAALFCSGNGLAENCGCFLKTVDRRCSSSRRKCEPTEVPECAWAMTGANGVSKSLIQVSELF